MAVMVAALGFAMQPAEAYQSETTRCPGCGKWEVSHDIKTTRVQDLFTDKVTVTARFDVGIRLPSEPDSGNMTPKPTGGIPLGFRCYGILRSDGVQHVDRDHAYIDWEKSVINELPFPKEMILRFGSSPPQTVEGNSLALSIGYLFLPHDLVKGYTEKLLGAQRLVGQVKVGPNNHVPAITFVTTAVWDVRGLDAAFRFAISLFEAESAQYSINLRNPCSW